MKDIISAVIERIGVVREPVLAFALLAALVIGVGGIYMAGHENPDLNVHGVAMIYLAIFKLFASLGVYVWMTFKLPGSAQEAALEEVTASLIAEHHAKRMSRAGA